MPRIGTAEAFGLLRAGESVLWGSLPLPGEPASSSVRPLPPTAQS